jgi:hypothetical protein
MVSFFAGGGVDSLVVSTPVELVAVSVLVELVSVWANEKLIGPTKAVVRRSIDASNPIFRMLDLRQ